MIDLLDVSVTITVDYNSSHTELMDNESRTDLQSSTTQYDSRLLSYD
jgi:hypothetical protein